MAIKHENVKWVDGLRGVASILVVFTHLARAFDPDLFNPTSNETSTPRFLQYPIVRLLVQGRTGVSIFSLVTGYVCALKPLRQIRAGQPNAAFISISKSAFRRVPRLLLPTTIATTLIWLICQFGVFTVAKRVDSWWVSYTSPDMTPYFGEALWSLWFQSIMNWTNGWRNIYDGNQWTLLPLLHGSMVVYTFLFATAFTQARHRMMIEMGFFVYYYICNDSAFGLMFIFGVFLCDLSLHPPHLAYLSTHPHLTNYLSPTLLLSGLLLASYPEANASWMRWSRHLETISHYILPPDADTPRFYTGLGLINITLAIHLSPHAKSILSNKYFLWLGKNSFAVYLLHGTLLRSLLVWLLFGIRIPADVVDDDGNTNPGPPLLICGGRLRWYASLALWFVLLYAVAEIWTRYVDARCARMTATLERYVLAAAAGELADDSRLGVEKRVDSPPMLPK